MTGNYMFWNTQHLSVRIDKRDEEKEVEKKGENEK